MTRASALLFLAVLTCSKGQRVANVPKDSVQSSAPLPVSLGAPDSLSTDGPLDEIPSLLAGFDSQAEAAREQARDRSPTDSTKPPAFNQTSCKTRLLRAS